MATRTLYLKFGVYLTDKSEVDRLQATDFGQGLPAGQQLIAPAAAVTLYGATLAPINHGDESMFPASPSAPYVAGNDIIAYWLPAGLLGYKYPIDENPFSRKSGGFLGIGGTTIIHRWVAEFIYVPPTGVSETGEPLIAMPTRRWIDGFEDPMQGASGSGSGTQTGNAEASRHAGGWGLGIRNSTVYKRHTPLEAGGAATNELWERFYFRLRRAPDTATKIWEMLGTPSTTVGMALYVTPSGQLTVNAQTTSATSVLSAPSTLTVNEWVKIDIAYKFGATGFFALFVNGVSVYSVAATAMPSGTGLNAANTISNCTLGYGATNHHGSWDYDDWVGAALPVPATAPNVVPAVDWLHGSKIVKLRPTGFGTTNGTWAGVGGADATDWRHTYVRPIGGAASLLNYLATSAASDRLVVTTDIKRQLAHPQSLGVAAMVLSRFGSRAHATLNGQLGYKIDAAAEVLATVAEATSVAWVSAWRFPSGLMAPETWDTLEAVFVANSQAASAKALYSLAVSVELIGDWHPEDHVVLSTDDPNTTWGVPHLPNSVHNHPYGESAWAQAGPPPLGPVIIHAGTYVGNAKSVQLAFRAPVHMLWIRATSGTPHNVTWTAGRNHAADTLEQGAAADVINLVQIDPNYEPADSGEDTQKGQVIVWIVGNHAAVNANGVTYQYVAWCDPGMRFSAAGQLRESVYGEALTYIGPTWEPEFGWFQRQLDAADANMRAWWSGIGAAANEIWTMTGGALITAAGDYLPGGILTLAGSGLYAASTDMGFIVFRRDDNSGDVGVPNVMQTASYTGDGAASRTVQLAPTNGRRPMWALVVGSNGTAIMRDPSHAGTASATAAGANNAATGITGGGVDSISVGSVLNTNGVVFDVFVFPGCDATTGAGTGGWGVNCENIPVDPATYDPDGDPDPWDEEPPEPEEPEEPEEPSDEDPGPEGSGGPGPAPRSPYPDFDFDEECLPWTQGIMNIALSRIGISKQITNILTDASPEGIACRLHYSEDASAVLRDHPWAAATRYEKMAAVMGDATEQDRVQSWLATVWYEEGEVVRRSDVDYYCIDAHVNHAPPNATYWSTEAPEEVNGDWLYCYRAPARMMFARRIVNPNKARRDWDPDPPRFRLAADDRSFTIYTNELNAELEYTIRPVCVAATDDALFRSALAWRHAHSIAAALSRDEDKVNYCWQMYQAVLAQAKRWAASEQQHAPTGDPDWITGRN